MVKLSYFVCVTLQEAARVLGIPADTTKDYSAHAHAGLFREMTKPDRWTQHVHEQVRGSCSARAIKQVARGHLGRGFLTRYNRDDTEMCLQPELCR